MLGLEVQTVYLASLGVSVLIMLGFWWFFTYSKHGLAMRATAFDQQVAQSLGVSRAEGLRDVLGDLGGRLGGRRASWWAW